MLTRMLGGAGAGEKIPGYRLCTYHSCNEKVCAGRIRSDLHPKATPCNRAAPLCHEGVKPPAVLDLLCRISVVEEPRYRGHAAKSSGDRPPDNDAFKWDCAMRSTFYLQVNGIRQRGDSKPKEYVDREGQLCDAVILPTHIPLSLLYVHSFLMHNDKLTSGG